MGLPLSSTEITAGRITVLDKSRMRDKAGVRKRSNSVHDAEIRESQIIVGDHGKMVNIFSPGLIALAITVLVAAAVALVFMAEPWNPSKTDQNGQKGTLQPVSPVEHGGRFYMSDDSGYLSALDVRTGKELWSFHQTGTTEISHTQDGTSRIYAGAAGRSANGLHALDASNGDRIWSKTSDSCAGNPVGTAESTLIVEADGYVCGLNKDTGEEKWRTEGSDCVLDRSGAVYLNTGPEVAALNAASGSIIWRAVVGEGALILTDENLYVETDKIFQAIDSETGKHRWTLSVDGLKFQDASTSTSTLFFMGEAGVHAINADTGNRAWSYVNPEVKDLRYSDGSVYILTSAELVALAEKTGEKRWVREVFSGVSLAVHRDKFVNLLYVLGGRISAVRTKNGDLAWNSPVLSTDLPPAMAEGAAVMAQDHNDITTLDPLNGATRWSHTSRGRVVSISYSGPPTAMDAIYRIR
ncbi:outer membrane protein assembly factor BamB family protein [Streptomyces sp. NPDC055254]